MALLASASVLALAGAVQWQAPAGCPTAAAVEGRVHELLGRMPAEHELRATGVVSGGPPWRLELETTIGGRRQLRALEGDDCHAVAEAAALIVAVSVDPVASGAAGGSTARGRERGAGGVGGAISEPPGPGSPSEAAAGERASEEPGASPLRRDDAPIGGPSRPRPRPRLHLRIGGGGETVAIPGGTGGVRLGLALEAERAFVQLDGSYWIDRLAVLRAGPPPSGARVGLGTAAVRGGLRLGGARVAVPLALGLEAGGLRVRAEGLARGRDDLLPWVAGVVGVGVQWSFSRRVALWGAVEGVLPLVRPRVRIGRTDAGAGTGDLVLHEVAVVGARALAGISIKIDGGP